MKVYVGSDAFARKLNSQYPCHLAGNLISPQHWYKSGKTRTVPYALDNGAWIAFKNQQPWEGGSFLNILNIAKQEGIKPDFVVCPDKVRDARPTVDACAIATNELWQKWYPILKEFPFVIAFAAQDGHQIQDIPTEADLVFLGGTTEWKLRNLRKFCANFPTHVARVNSYSRLWLAHNSNIE